MSMTSIKVQIPGAAVAARMRELRRQRDDERAVAMQRVIATSEKRAEGRDDAEILARRELIVLERGSAGRLDDALAGGRLEEANRLAAVAEREIDAEWTAEAMQECALAEINDHPWSSVRAGSRELSADGRLLATIDFDDGRSMSARTSGAPATALDGSTNADGSIEVELRVAGAGISRVETATGTAIGCDAELAYITKWAQDSGLGAEVIDPEVPGPGAAAASRSHLAGGSR